MRPPGPFFCWALGFASGVAFMLLCFWGARVNGLITVNW